MSVLDPATVQCPDCGACDAIDLSTGDWLCLSCRNEWNPRDVPIVAPAPDTGPVAGFTLSPSLSRIFDATDAGEVLRAPSEEFDASEPAPAGNGAGGVDWTGEFVRYERMGVDALVVEDHGKAKIEIQDADGTTYKVMRSSCVIIDVPGRNDAAIADTLDATAADDQPMAQTILAVAGLTLTVALDAIEAAGGDDVGNPRIGWLPPPANEVPEVEQGVAYAAGFLIHVFGLDKGEVRKLAANLMTGASIDATEGATE